MNGEKKVRLPYGGVIVPCDIFSLSDRRGADVFCVPHI